MTKDEFYTAAKNSLEFEAQLTPPAVTFALAQLSYTRIENEWIDLDADDVIDLNEWQLSFIDRHQFYVYSGDAATMTTVQATAAGYSSSDQVLLDANSDGTITFIEYAAYITADRDWTLATNGSSTLDLAGALAIGKSVIEWEFLDSNYDGSVSLAEWQAGRQSENSFMTIKNDDTVDDIPKAALETFVTNSSYTLWYDENADDSITWTEWINYAIDQNMWTLLDADTDDHASPAEFQTMGFDADAMILWLDTDANGYVDFAEWIVGCVAKNVFDVNARASTSATEGDEPELIDLEEFEAWTGTFFTWKSLDADNNGYVNLTEWVDNTNLEYAFTQIANYASNAVPASDFAAVTDASSNVVYSQEAVDMLAVDPTTSGSISTAEFFDYQGDLNDWNRVVNSVDGNVHFLSAFNDGWTDLEFYFFNLN